MLFCSSLALSFPSLCFSFPAGDVEEVGGGEEDAIPLSGEEVPVASESSLGKRLCSVSMCWEDGVGGGNV